MNYLHSKDVTISELEKFSFFMQFLMITLCFHKKKFSHRDIKPENIVYFKQDNTWKFVDFGTTI